MVLSTSKTSTANNYVIDDVISKTRCELVYNGELDESVLSQIQSKWITKMLQAGVTSGTIHTPDPILVPVNADNSTLTGIDAQFLRSSPSVGLVMPTKTERDGFHIPQQDGAKDEVTEPYTYALNELLNEDDDEEDAIDDDDDDMNIPHLVMCQFDKVKRCKNKWECKFNAGVMQINGKNVIFSEATGDFNF